MLLLFWLLLCLGKAEEIENKHKCIHYPSRECSLSLSEENNPYQDHIKSLVKVITDHGGVVRKDWHQHSFYANPLECDASDAARCAPHQTGLCFLRDR